MLSGGQKPRLLLALGLLIKAECTLLDDITASLDDEGKSSFIQLLYAIIHKNKWFLML